MHSVKYPEGEDPERKKEESRWNLKRFKFKKTVKGWESSL